MSYLFEHWQAELVYGLAFAVIAIGSGHLMLWLGGDK